MNCGPCYRRNLPPPLRLSLPFGCARNSTSAAILAALVCALAGLCLVACGKSAAQYIDRGNQLYAAGKYGDATLNYRNAIQEEPEFGRSILPSGSGAVEAEPGGRRLSGLQSRGIADPKNIQAKIQLANLSLAIYSRDPKHPAASLQTGADHGRCSCWRRAAIAWKGCG